MAEMILVVDDDPDIARFVEVNLRSAGYDVVVAADGDQALELSDQGIRIPGICAHLQGRQYLELPGHGLEKQGSVAI